MIPYPSPNFGERKAPIDMLVLHYTGMDTAQAALERLADPTLGDARVSAHYLVDEQGQVFQLVDEQKRAWHAGESYWRGQTDINSRSIGIEIANPGDVPFPPAQMAAVAGLCKEIIARHGIPSWNVVGHSDIAPGRKADPGELFDWKWLAQQGVGLWPEAKAEPEGMLTWVARLLGFADAPLRYGDHGSRVLAMQQKLHAYGYNIPECSTYGADTRQAVEDFQRHFRAHQIDGVWDGECDRLLVDLLTRAPSATLGQSGSRMAAV